MFIQIDNTTIETIKAFATEYYDKKERYESFRRGDTHSRERRIQQGMIGKMAEEAVANAFGSTKPDYNHYARGTHMVDPDLSLEGLNLHVKACSQSRCDWVADPSTDRIVRNPDPSDVLVFCKVDVAAATVQIMAVAAATDLVDHWSDPQAYFMRAKGKRAIYFNDIKSLEGVEIPA